MIYALLAYLTAGWTMEVGGWGLEDGGGIQYRRPLLAYKWAK